MASKTKKKTKGRKSRQQEFSLQNEVVLLLILAASIVIFICTVGQGGMFGKAISAFFFGAFGLMAYVFPFWLFLVSAFLTANQNRNGKVIMKTAAAVLLFVFLCTLVHLLMFGSDSMSIGSLLEACISEKNGGGLLGAALGVLFTKTVGLACAYVIASIALIISIVMITEKSFFGGLKKGGAKVYETAREDVRRHKERLEIKREQEMEEADLQPQRSRTKKQETSQRRQDRKVSGVAFGGNTSMKEAKRGRKKRFAEDMNEIIIDIPQAEAVGAYPTDIGSNTASFSQSFPVSESETGETVKAVHTQDISKQSQGKRSQTSASSAGEVKKCQPTNGMGLRNFGLQNAVNISSSDATVLEDDYPAPTIHGARDSQLTNSQEMDPATQKYNGSHSAGVTGSRNEVPASQMHTPSEAQSQIPEPQIHIANEETPEAQEPTVSSAPKKNKKQDAATISDEVADISDEIQQNAEIEPGYEFPPVSLLKEGDPNASGDSRAHLQEMSNKLQMTLTNFGVKAHVTNVTCGPSVTRYEIQPEMGVKVSKIVGLADDIKLNLAVADIRIEAPIPGKAAIGIEVPNKENVTVAFRDLVESKEFQGHASNIAFAAGKDIAGNVIVADIAKMPHLLIAGATGSGKSVCINTIIMSILYKAHPEDVKLIMIDPKVVELSVYNGIPHLFIPVVTDPKKAAGALHWAVSEMTDRYQKFAEYNVRDLKGYNKKIESIQDIDDPNKPQKMPQIVIIVDELADLMMVAPGDVEDAICRLAQLARAAGIHLIIATQRPSVNVITGLIKANMPSRIAFSVTSGVDSRTILDMNGAEKLLGKGDMLFYPQGYQKPVRVQGAFVSDNEVSDVVEYLTEKNGVGSYDASVEEKVKSAATSSMGGGSGFTSSADDRDIYFAEAGKFIIEKEKGSIGMLQRMFKVGFNRAARIMDQLEEAGVVGPEEGTKPRKVLMSMEEFEQYIDEYV